MDVRPGRVAAVAGPSVADIPLSIIIPCLNEAAGIAPGLRVLQPLRQQSVEIIVVDGGSHDATVALAKPLVDVVLTSAPGRAVQMNTGARVAQGDWLLFLHSDTRLPGDAEQWLEVLSGQSRRWGFFPVRLSGGHPGLRVIERFMNWRSRLTSIATGDQCLFVGRDVFASLGGFASIPLMEDVDLSRRLCRHWAPWIWQTPVVTSSRRWETKGLFRTVCLMWWLRLAFFIGVKPGRLHRWYYGTVNHE